MFPAMAINLEILLEQEYCPVAVLLAKTNKVAKKHRKRSYASSAIYNIQYISVVNNRK